MLSNGHANQSFFYHWRELPRTHHQGCRTIAKGTYEIATPNQTYAVMQSDIRSCGDNLLADLSHAHILPSQLTRRAQHNTPIQPREKLRDLGAAHLQDEELLAIFLRTGIKGKTALALAHELLNTYGSLSQILALNFEEIQAIKGIGLAKWSQLQACYELVQRSFADQMRQQNLLSSSSLVKNYLVSTIGQLDHEVFTCLYLDSHMKLISAENMFRGSVTETRVHPREVAKACLLKNCSYLIVAHNHPSGTPDPSADDIHLTEHLYEALLLLDITLLDHVIASKSYAISMHELNLMPGIAKNGSNH